jgi:hypothetical protein
LNFPVIKGILNAVKKVGKLSNNPGRNKIIHLALVFLLTATNSYSIEKIAKLGYTQHVSFRKSRGFELETGFNREITANSKIGFYLFYSKNFSNVFYLDANETGIEINIMHTVENITVHPGLGFLYHICDRVPVNLRPFNVNYGYIYPAVNISFRLKHNKKYLFRGISFKYRNSGLPNIIEGPNIKRADLSSIVTFDEIVKYDKLSLLFMWIIKGHKKSDI